MRSAVVLPLPDGPTSTQISSALTSSERSWMAGLSCPGYRLVTLRYETDAAACPASTSANLLAAIIPRPRPHARLFYDYGDCDEDLSGDCPGPRAGLVRRRRRGQDPRSAG